MYTKASRALLVVFVATACFFSGGSSAQALSCIQPPENILDRGDVIFAGVVAAVTPSEEVTDDSVGLRRGGTATFDVSKYWKGDAGTPVTVYDIYAWGTPGPYFKVGQKYIVFAHANTVGTTTTLSAGIDCGSTSLISNDTVSDLDKAIAGRAPTTPLPVAPFSRDLSYSVSGSDVALLQKFLEEKGFLIIPPGVMPGYFGPLTRTALSQYQVARHISPAYGYFGPITREQVTAEMMNREGVM